MLQPVRTSAPAATPVSVAECKGHLNVTHTDHDSLIGIYLQAAVDRLDGYAGLLGRCIITQSWRQDFGCWPGSRILRLPFPNVSAIASVKYSDADDAEQTVSGSLYDRYDDERGGFVRFKDTFDAPALNTDRLDPVRVTFAAGYGDATAVPFSIKAAILLLVGDSYEHREDTAVGVGLDARPLPNGVAALIAPHRRVGL